MNTFEELNLNNQLLKSLKDNEFIHPTIIQQKAFSPIMSGHDVFGIAQTGTGKTLAYLLPTLRMYAFSKEKTPQIVIVVPTRELVVQVVDEVRKMATYMNLIVAGIYGGSNINPQRVAVSGDLDVLVATPGRLVDFISDGTLKPKLIKRLIIDEVDEMLNLGFRAQIKHILDFLPQKRQNIMFSATSTEDVEMLIEKYFNNPIKIEAAPTGTPLKNITQIGYKLPNFNTKVNMLDLLLASDESMKKVVVFVDSKNMADELYFELENYFGDEMCVIHSGKTQPKRFEAIHNFKSDKSRILIATDLISRGIDIAEVTHVINFDTPDVPEQYIHRIGRTGRADANGIAITFMTKNDAKQITAIQNLMKKKIKIETLPEKLIISDILTEDEKPKVVMKTIEVKTPKKVDVGASFHEKSEKNMKVNQHLTRGAKMKLKYGKSKTRSGKKNEKKKP